jgi:hypothetical protein
MESLPFSNLTDYHFHVLPIPYYPQRFYFPRSSPPPCVLKPTMSSPQSTQHKYHNIQGRLSPVCAYQRSPSFSKVIYFVDITGSFYYLNSYFIIMVVSYLPGASPQVLLHFRDSCSDVDMWAPREDIDCNSHIKISERKLRRISCKCSGTSILEISIDVDTVIWWHKVATSDPSKIFTTRQRPRKHFNCDQKKLLHQQKLGRY